MGNITSNMSIYIPAAGETNYDQSFAMGMINIDQHDHSGPPDNGVPIAGAGIAAGSITFDKLNANVADNTTGIGTETGANANKLQLLGILPNIYNVGSNGLLVANGTSASTVAITGTPNQITVLNGNGTAGNPTLSLAATVSNSTQPAFSATIGNNAGVTGDGTAFLIPSATTTFDQGSNFNAGTCTFTAPLAGVYLLTIKPNFTGLASDNNLGFVDFYKNGTLFFRGLNINYGTVMNSSNGIETSYSEFVKLNASDAITVVVTISGSATKNVTINGGTFSAVKIW